MTRRSVVIFTVSFLILLAIFLWLTRIASLVIPPLLNNETLQIDDLKISSIGWRQVSIARLSGNADIDSGRVYFDLRDTLVDYDLFNLRPGPIEVAQADIEYKAADQRDSRVTTIAEPINLPPQVVIDQLSFTTYRGVEKFNGFFEFTGSEEDFSAFAQDDKSRWKIIGKTTLSEFRVTLERFDKTEIAAFKIELEGFDSISFDGTVQFSPLLDWLRDTQPLPQEYQDVLSEIKMAVGSVHTSGKRSRDQHWQAQIKLDVNNIATEQFYANAELTGDLRVDFDDWTFVFHLPGSVQINVPSDQLDQISTIRFDLPQDYLISRSELAQNSIAATGDGTARVRFQRIGETNLNADLVHWELRDWKEAIVDLQNIEMVSPFAAHAIGAQSKFLITHTTPMLLTGDINVRGTRTEDWPADLPSFDLQGNWNWNDGAFDIKGIGSWQGLSTTNWSLVNNNNSGALHVELDTPIADLFQSMQSFFKNRKQNILFSEGVLKADLNWSWNDQLYDSRLELLATDIDAGIYGVELRDGSLRINSSDLTALSMHIESSFSTMTLANGVDVKDVAIKGRWQNGLQVDQASMAVFGGAVKLDPVFLNFDGIPNDIVLKVKEIELANLLAMLDQEGLKGDGTLSGAIPLQIAQKGIAVNNGYLKNNTKGTLSYNFGDEPPLELNNLALQALQDFRYDVLDVNLNYQTTGDYTIRARLEGRNPQLYDGYPIAFNINLNGSLPGLLKASLVTGDFHGEILKQIQQEQ